MNLKQRETLARLIAEFGAHKWKREAEQAAAKYEEILNILLPDDKEQ